MSRAVIPRVLATLGYTQKIEVCVRKRVWALDQQILSIALGYASCTIHLCDVSVGWAKVSIMPHSSDCITHTCPALLPRMSQPEAEKTPAKRKTRTVSEASRSPSDDTTNKTPATTGVKTIALIVHQSDRSQTPAGEGSVFATQSPKQPHNDVFELLALN